MARRWSIAAVRECERRMGAPEHATTATLAPLWGLTPNALNQRLLRAGVRLDSREGLQRGGHRQSLEECAIIRQAIARVNTAAEPGHETWAGLAVELGWQSRCQDIGRAFRCAVVNYCRRERLPMPRVGRGRWRRAG
jgi:hypothetical protein